MENLFQLFYETTGVSTDTRKIKKDCLFICLSGANFDGNLFAKDALKLGAKFVIADDNSVCDNVTVFYVKDSLLFLQKLANFHRKKFNIPVLGITGSNGKTTTKELINCVLAKKYKTLATEGNLNNHIGVPLTLLNLNETHEIAIVEMGANKFFDIQELCQIAEPNHGIITNIGKAHLEGFINFEGVLKTKKELYDAIEKEQGTLFYNQDDEILTTILPKNINKISYGTKDNCTINGELVALTPLISLKWKSKEFNSEVVNTNLIGKYNFYNFLAAISIGTYFNVDSNKISEAISSYVPTNNRSQIVKTKTNTLILDAYNANPTSMQVAIESFVMLKETNKIAILGDMFELGADSKMEHKKIIDLLVQYELDCFLVGRRFFEFSEQIFEKIKFFETKEDLKQHIDKQNISSTYFLLKGSRGIGLEEIVEKL